MTTGIYKLKFKGTDKVYIGQSLNIEYRLMQHKSLFKSAKASAKMMGAFTCYGFPTIEVLEVCSREELDDLEAQYIIQYDSMNNGFNTRSSAAGGSNLWGASNGRAIYSNEQIIDCLFLLIQTPKLTYPQIQDITQVLKATIVDIANGTGHTWLEQKFPSEYAILKSYRKCRNTREYMKAVSPTGEVFTVTHLSNFCSEHKLQTGNMSKLLRGKCKSYGGWTAIPLEI